MQTSFWNKEKIDLALSHNSEKKMTYLASSDQNEKKKYYKNVSIDTRTIQEDDIFLALKGEYKNGHDYITQAIQKKATALIIEENYLTEEIKEFLKKGISIFVVSNTLHVLQQLSAYYRKELNPTTIAITGSNGKTSTCFFLKDIMNTLEGEDRVASTLGNFNNHIGLPLSLLSMKECNKFAIMEVGMNHPGEISSLSNILCPDYSLITSIAEAHIAHFKNIEEIAKEKLSIVEGMSEKSHLFFPMEAIDYQTKGTKKEINNKIAELARFQVKTHNIHLHFFPKAKDISLNTKDGIAFKWRSYFLQAKHSFHPAFAHNACASFELLATMGYAERDIIDAFKTQQKKALSIKQAPRRFEVFFKKRSAQIYEKTQILVDDSYNANLSSFKAAIQSLAILRPYPHKLLLIAGEMAELGTNSKKAHLELAKELAKYNYSAFAFSGLHYVEDMKNEYLYSLRTEDRKKAKFWQAENPEDLYNLLIEEGVLESYDGILIKGSRSAKMDIISDKIKNLVYA